MLQFSSSEINGKTSKKWPQLAQKAKGVCIGSGGGGGGGGGGGDTQKKNKKLELLAS